MTWYIYETFGMSLALRSFTYFIQLVSCHENPPKSDLQLALFRKKKLKSISLEETFTGSLPKVSRTLRFQIELHGLNLSQTQSFIEADHVSLENKLFYTKEKQDRKHIHHGRRPTEQSI